MSESLFVRRDRATLFARTLDKRQVYRGSTPRDRSQAGPRTSCLIAALREAMLVATVGLLVAWLAAETALWLMPI